jgi:hypothetical protein
MTMTSTSALPAPIAQLRGDPEADDVNSTDVMGDMLESGRSQPCATYGSPMLTQKAQFHVLDFEVWVVMKVETV